MPKSPLDPIENLLSRGNLSGAQRDEIFERVIEQTVLRERRHIWRRWVARWGPGTGLALSAALAVALWARPRNDSDELRAKGGGGAPGLTVNVECQPGSLSACARGSTLVFSVEGAPAGAYLAGYAEPARGGERIWYFSADGESPALGTPDSRVLARGVRLGPEHAPGAHRVRLLVTARPLDRSALLHPSRDTVIAERVFDLQVVP